MLLHGIGFCNYFDFDQSTQDKKKLKEENLVKEAWKVIAKYNNANDFIDSWSIFVFCFTVIGVYDGVDNESEDRSYLGSSGLKKPTQQSNILGISNNLLTEEPCLNPIVEIRNQELEENKNNPNVIANIDELIGSPHANVYQNDQEFDMSNYIGTNENIQTHDMLIQEDNENIINRKESNGIPKSRVNHKSTPGLRNNRANNLINFDSNPNEVVNVHTGIGAKTDRGLKIENQQTKQSNTQYLNKVNTLTTVNTKKLKNEKESLVNNGTAICLINEDPKVIDSLNKSSNKSNNLLNLESSINRTGNLNTKISASFFRTNQSKSIVKKKENYQIFKIVCPNLNMSHYTLSSKIVKQIKLLFRYFYDSRNTYISEIKKNELERKIRTQTQENFKPSTKLTSSMDKPASYYKNKCFEVS